MVKFSPAPKPFFKGKKSKTREWEKTRRELKQEFEQMGVSYCELMLDTTKCWRGIGLGFAHIDKRRHLKPGEEKMVVLACNPCHSTAERWPRKRMRKHLEKIIANRKPRVDKDVKNLYASTR